MSKESNIINNMGKFISYDLVKLGNYWSINFEFERWNGEVRNVTIAESILTILVENGEENNVIDNVINAINELKDHLSKQSNELKDEALSQSAPPNTQSINKSDGYSSNEMEIDESATSSNKRKREDEGDDQSKKLKVDESIVKAQEEEKSQNIIKNAIKIGISNYSWAKFWQDAFDKKFNYKSLTILSRALYTKYHENLDSNQVSSIILQSITNNSQTVEDYEFLSQNLPYYFGYQEPDVINQLESFCQRAHEKLSTIFANNENSAQEIKSLVNIVTNPENQAVPELYSGALKELRQIIYFAGIFVTDDILVKGLKILIKLFENLIQPKLANIDFAKYAFELKIEEIKKELHKPEKIPDESFGEFLHYEFDNSSEQPVITFATSEFDKVSYYNIRDKATAIELLKKFITQGLDNSVVNSIVECIAQLTIDKLENEENLSLEASKINPSSEQNLTHNEKEDKSKGKEKIETDLSLEDSEANPSAKQTESSAAGFSIQSGVPPFINSEDQELKLALELSKQSLKEAEEKAEGGSGSGQNEVNNQANNIETEKGNWFKILKEKINQEVQQDKSVDQQFCARQIPPKFVDKIGINEILPMSNGSEFEERQMQKAVELSLATDLDKQFNEKFPESTNFIDSEIFLATLKEINFLAKDNPAVFNNIDNDQHLKELCQKTINLMQINGLGANLDFKVLTKYIESFLLKNLEEIGDLEESEELITDSVTETQQGSSSNDYAEQVRQDDNLNNQEELLGSDGLPLEFDF